MRSVVAGLDIVAALASVACAASLLGCGSGDSSASDGGIKYGADGPVYSFLPMDAGQEAATPVGPLASLSSYFVDFGSTACGATTDQTVTFINNGDSPLNVSTMISGTNFAVNPSSLIVEGGGAFAVMTVTATVPGSATAGTLLKGALNVTTNDPAQSTVTIPLQILPTGATLVTKPAAGMLNFPESEVGEGDPQSFFVTNQGNAGAVVTMSAPSSPLFVFQNLPEGGVTLNAGDTWVGTALFTAPDMNTASATSTVAIAGAQCGQSVPSISFTGEGAYGHLTDWPTVIDFGPAPCGGAAPAPQSFQVTNTSTVDARLASLSITPPNSGFTTDATVGFFFGGGHPSRPITVNAPPIPSPSPLTPITATLTIQTDADSSPHTITLQEEPQGAVLGFDTSATASFGSFGQVVLLQSSTQNFAVTNIGTAAADVTLSTGGPPSTGVDAGSDAGADATVAASPPAPFTIATHAFSVPANGTQTNSVTFTPAGGQVYVDGITMTASGSICSVLAAPLPLSGVGLGGGASIAPSAVAFTPTCGGPPPDAQLVLLTNRGPADLTWSLGPVTGPGAAQYTVTALRAPGLLPSGQSASLRVTGKAIPSPAPNPDPAALAAQFAITTDVPLDNPHVVPLTEKPLGDQLSVSVGSLRFGQFPLDHMTPPQTFTITNAANPGSPAANLTLALTGDGGAAEVLPEEGGTVCTLSADGGASDGPGACPVPDAGDGGDGGDARADGGCGDAGDGGDCPPVPELVVSGYVLGSPQAVMALGPGGSMSAPQVVTFIPTAAATYPAAIAIQTFDPQCTAPPGPIQLAGAGTQGEVSISATTLAFGTDPNDPDGLVNCGATGLTHTLKVVNNGNQVVNITGLSFGLGANSPYQLSGPGASIPAAIAIGSAVSLEVTPAPIPATVANPNDPSPFSDTLTIRTDAMFDTPHTVSLVMQARGAIIGSRPLDDTWDFGTVNLGSIGTFSNAVQNVGNAPVLLSLQGLTHPTVFGLKNNPTTGASNGLTAFFGQFAPPAETQDYTDQGTLVVTPVQAFCEPLPATWNNPTILLSGSSNANPPITVSGSLAFPSSECGNAAPGGQSITLTNNTNQAYTYAPSFGSGAFYTVADAGPGIIDANGAATIVVNPRSIAPGQGVQPGSAPYADTLVVTAAPAGAMDAGSSPSAPSFTIPISWTLNGAVLSLPEGAGPKSDSQRNAYYPADTATGFTVPMDNSGTESATVSLSFQPSNALTVSPGGSQAVAAGKRAAPRLSSTASDVACPATTSATATFFYSGSICQPFQVPQLTVRACRGTFP
jgi:hypothetical protein